MGWSSFVGQVVPFIHPGLAAAAVATGLIPVVVHLINRRRYARVPWAAMTFLLAAHRRSVRRVRLEQWLLLALRVSALVLLGLALARPYLPVTALVPLESTRMHRIVLLDDSLSMKARTEDGRSRFAVAKDYAERLLESFPPTDAISIVTLSEPAKAVVSQAAFDRRFVKERLGAIGVTQRGTDTVGAVAAALAIMEDSPLPEGNQSVYVVSDFPRHDWESDSPDDATAAIRAARQVADAVGDSGSNLVFALTSPSRAENLGIEGLRLGPSLGAIGFPTGVVVAVHNHGEQGVYAAGLQIRRDGEIIRNEPLPHLPPGEVRQVVVTTAFSSPGTHLVEARISRAETESSAGAKDALHDDDSRYLSVETRERIPILLVDGRTGARRLTGQTGYLATALAPRFDASRSGSNIFTPHVISESELGGEVLGDYDAIVLCNVERLSVETWRRLEDFAERGGGVMFFGGDLVDAENYNRLGFADGKGLVPGRLSGVRQTATAGGGGGAEDGDALFIKQEGLGHPVVAEFDRVTESGLFSARVRQYLPMRLEAAQGDVVLSLTNGDPLLVAGRFGAGRVLFCTTTANMEWTTLPAKGDYVSLIVNAMSSLAPPRGEHRNLTVGQMLREPLTPIETAMSLRVTSTDPDAPRAEPSLVPHTGGDRLAGEYGPIEHAGVATLSVGKTERRFAINVDPEESRLAVIDGETLRRLLDRPVQVVGADSEETASPSRGRASELSLTLLVAGLVLLCVEMAVAMSISARGWASAPRS
ncbi:MAG: BatA domain-containing protein, partial [Phycisphaerae bacterium]